MGFDSFPNGWAAIYGDSAIPSAGLAQIVLLAGFLELGVMKDSANGAAPGDFPGTSATDPSTSDGTPLTRRPRLSSVALSSTMAVLPCAASLDLWSTSSLEAPSPLLARCK